MARVNTNNTSLRFATEASVGVLPGTPQWRIAEFNSIGSYGATITTTVRRPISQDRGRKKGTVTDLESAVEYETDLTVDAFTDFSEGFVFAEFANKEFNLRDGTDTIPPPATSTSYTIDGASALLAGKVDFTATYHASLVFAKGYALTANNGLKVLTAGLSAAGTAITVSGLSAETPPTKANLQVAGVRMSSPAGTDKITLTITGSTATLVIADSGTNFPTWASMGLFKGMFIHIGSPTAAGALQFGLGTAGTQSFGYARISSLSGDTLNLDKLSSTLVTATDNTAVDCDIMFGRWLRNVPVTAAAADNTYLERTYQMEVSYPDLGGVGTDEFEYAIGNYVNELTLNLPITDKATLGYNFIGTNSDDITPTRKTDASAAVSPIRTVAFNTASDIVSISTDAVSAASDICFKSLTVSVRNNVSPEKCLGTLGASFVNSGLFEIDIEGQMLFTDKTITNSIKNNTTLTFLSILRNEDGAIAFDIPEMTLGDGSRDYPVDQSVLVNVTGMSFTSSSYGYDASFTVFPAVPWA